MEVRRTPLIVSGLIVAASATTAMADLKRRLMDGYHLSE